MTLCAHMTETSSSVCQTALRGETRPQWKKMVNCWRTTGDIKDTWDKVYRQGFTQTKWAPFVGPGHWIDPDMLVVGMVGWGPKLHYTRLTADEPIHSYKPLEPSFISVADRMRHGPARRLHAKPAH